MSNAQLRQVLRWSHIIEGALIAAFVYSSTLRESLLYSATVQFVVLPLAIISGIFLWQQARISKWRRATARPTKSAQSEG